MRNTQAVICLAGVIIGKASANQPQPPNSEFDWGMSCAKLTDGFCGEVNNCGECRFSKPIGAAWNDSRAACRCSRVEGDDSKVKPQPPNNEYDWGSACAQLTDGFCSDVKCADCRFSKPIGAAWNDSRAACRCAAEENDDSKVDPEPQPQPSPEPQPDPVPEPSNDDYVFGNDCATLTDQLCGEVDCAECRWSWPVGSDWNDPNAACRCSREADSDSSVNPDPQPSTDDYVYGNDCANLTDEFCGDLNCAECRWSWPVGSDWNDPNAACRCSREEENDSSVDPEPSTDDYEFGDDCAALTDQFCSEVNCAECRWSWPVGTNWDDPNAACRCSRETDDDSSVNPEPQPSIDEYEYGNDCANLTDEFCSEVDCAECRWSWPVGSDWADPDAACRCSREVGENEDEIDSGYPSLEVEIDGKKETLYVQTPSWSSAGTDGAEVSFDYNNRMYLSTSKELDTSKYFRANLLGGSIKYNVDLSQAGCGCVTAFYTVLMPAVDNTSDPFKYCDANKVGGHWCPEFDIMEANKYAFKAIGHTCDAPDGNGKYHNCDRGGQCTNDVLANNLQMDYGPSAAHIINTMKAFSVETIFHESNGVFTGYTTVLEQDGKQVVMQSSNCSYLNRMTDDMTDMALVISNWGSSGLDWLQHGVCTGTCSRSGTFSSISDFQITTGSK